MQAEYLYEETIVLRGFTAIVSIFTAGCLFVLVYQSLVGPLGDNPPPNWFLLSMFLLFLTITINFSTLSIKLSFRSVVVGYGIFKHTTFWGNIERCYLDEVSSIRYGGWGIRIGRVKGKWRLVYTVIRGPRVVLALKKGWFREFVFSTKKPEEVMKIVGQKIGRISQA